LKRLWFQPALLTLSLAIAAVATLLTPIGIAAINWEEISLDFVDLLWRSAPHFAVLGLALMFLSAAVARVAGAPRAVALLAAVLVGVVVQTNFFLWSYGAFDGSPIDWSEHAGKGVLELVVWAALLGFSLFRSEAVARSAYLVTAAALAVQLAGTATTLYENAPYAPKEKAPEVDLETLEARFTTFSRSSNVLVVVLDAFQSDLFAELMTDSAIASRVPPGLTYYRNAVSHYTFTRLSMQSIVTSRFIDDRIPSGEWVGAQMKQSVPARLAAQGHTTSVLTTAPGSLGCGRMRRDFDCLSHVAYLKAVATKGAPVVRDWDREDDLRSVWNLSLFRLAPHFAKPRVHAGGSWIIPAIDAGEGPIDKRIWYESKRDLRIFRKFTRSARAEDVPPTFKLLHFYGAHIPNSLTRSCGWNGLTNPGRKDVGQVVSSSYRPRQYLVDSAACVLTRLFALLERLDEIGVYDESLIFVVSDHGAPNQPIDLEAARPPIAEALRPAEPEPGHARHPKPNRGVPLFLVKRTGARHALRVSDAPVALCDVPRSIFRELDLEEDYGCDSVFDESRESPRLHFRVDYSVEVDRGGYVFERYVVDGHSWFRNSWIPASGAAATPER
jgi:hypothetical protein